MQHVPTDSVVVVVTYLLLQCICLSSWEFPLSCYSSAWSFRWNAYYRT